MKGVKDLILIQKVIARAIKISNLLLAITSVLLIIISTWVMTAIEPDTFQEPFDALWWVMTTVTTVGYGDFYPTSYLGRIYAMFLYIFGIGLIGIVIGKIIDTFSVYRKRKEEGLLKFKGKGHIVIIGWSQKANFAIKEILSTRKDIDIVLIDKLETTPIDREEVHYIKGDSTDEEILDKANLKEAQSVLIFADDTIQDATLTDGKTLLIATTIERYAPEIRSTVEIMNENHIQNFRHVRVDEFVLSHEMISRLAVRSAMTSGISAIYGQLLSREDGDNLYEIRKQPGWKTYGDAFHDLLNMGATLISDREKLNVNRNLHLDIPENARLYVICDQETYQKISNM
jgi:voltage-gated potassium channel